MYIVKRDGTNQEYNQQKIANAIAASFYDVDEVLEDSELDSMLSYVKKECEATLYENGVVTIKDIQEHVEYAIIVNSSPRPARAYIIYRTIQDSNRIDNHVSELEKYLISHNDYLPEVNINLVIKQVEIDDKLPIQSPENIQAILLGIKSLVEIGAEYDKLACRVLLDLINSEVMSSLGVKALTSNSLAVMLRLGLTEGLYGKEAEQYIPYVHQLLVDNTRNENFDFMGLTVIYTKYLTRNRAGKVMESPQMFWMRIAMGINSNEKDPIPLVLNVYDKLSTMSYIHSTPTLFNSLLTHSQTASCYLLTPDDSIEGIFEMVKQNAHLSKYAGGIGNDWTPVRANNALIKGTNGRSQGIIPFLKLLSDEAVAVNQSGRRLGSIATYLEPWHADYLDYLTIKKEVGDPRRLCHDLNTASWIPDLFMERVKADEEWSFFSPDEAPELHELVGEAFKEKYEEYEAKGVAGELHVYETISAVHLWRLTLASIYETGGPWLCWKDPSNERYPNQHKGVVHSSNLCVHPDTKVFTRDGYQVISDIVDTQVECWNGGSWGRTIIRKTGEDKPMIKVTNSVGHELTCTKYHKWVILDSFTQARVTVETHELKEGDVLVPFTCPALDHIGTEVMDSARAKGGLGEDVPTMAHDKASRLEWLGGYLDNKHILYPAGYYVGSIVLPAAEVDRKVLMFFHELGLSYTLEDEYMGEVIDVMVFSGSTLDRVVAHGLRMDTVGLDPHLFGTNHHTTTVVSIEDAGRSDTYCGKEEKMGMMVFNGILTKNCTEITLHTTTEETAVCMLATVAVGAHLDDKGELLEEKLEDTVYTAVRSLDNLIEYNYYPTKPSKTSNMLNRPLGLGMIGLQDALNELKIGYSSEQACTIAERFAQGLSFYAIKASIMLAKEKGAYPNYEGSLWDQGILPQDTYEKLKKKRRVKFIVRENHDWDGLRKDLKKYGIRNGTLLSQPPTATVSLVTNLSQSTEPTYQHLYIKSNNSGDFTIINKYLVNELKELGLWGYRTLSDLKKSGGLIDNLDYIPNDIKERYKVAFDVDYFYLLKNAALRQIWFDQAMSTNLYVVNATGKQLNDMYMAAYDMGLKTTYYLRTLRKGVGEADMSELDDGCEMCQ